MRPVEDTYRHKGLRKKLVDTIRSKGITDEKVLEAIGNIPRHFFLDSAFDEVAYEDRAFPIGEGQTISQPYTVAYQTQLLEIRPFEKVLEIGTGSAYQATVLASVGAQVYTIERQKKLFEQSYEDFLRSVTVGNETELMTFLKMDEDKTHIEVESALSYLKLKKIKRMLLENQIDLEKKHTPEEYRTLSQTHDHLKQMEREISGKLGAVIIK
jgi:hypothetical protein